MHVFQRTGHVQYHLQYIYTYSRQTKFVYIKMIYVCTDRQLRSTHNSVLTTFLTRSISLVGSFFATWGSSESCVVRNALVNVDVC